MKLVNRQSLALLAVATVMATPAFMKTARAHGAARCASATRVAAVGLSTSTNVNVLVTPRVNVSAQSGCAACGNRGVDHCVADDAKQLVPRTAGVMVEIALEGLR